MLKKRAISHYSPVKKLFNKIFKKENKEELYKNKILKKISEYHKKILDHKSVSFLHFGHLGDIINSLACLKEISKTKKCNLYIQLNKRIPSDVSDDNHPFGNVYLSEKSINKLMPLLKKQVYIENVEIYNNQAVDIDLNYFRELPINFNMDSVRWYSHLMGIYPDLSKSWIDVDDNQEFKDYIVVMRSLRRQNKSIDYSFLNKYKNVVFLGLHDEYIDIKKMINNIKHYDSKDFLELASIIKNSKLFIGNLSFGYALAEAIKVPRILESFPNFPMVYPNGSNGYDFYFQEHLEKLVEKLN